MKAVDDFVPTPTRALDKPFSMPIEDVFSIQVRTQCWDTYCSVSARITRFFFPSVELHFRWSFGHGNSNQMTR